MDEKQNTPAIPEDPPVDAKASIKASSDGMRAEVCLTPPESGGFPVSEELIRVELMNKKITHGINDEQIERLVKAPMYHIDILIAEGDPPKHGENAGLNVLIRTEKDIRPKELPDGSVDYKDLGIIQLVYTGDVLCEKTPATAGEPGTNIYGAAVSAKPGKDTVMPAGKNTVVSEDKLLLLAACDGHADIVNRKIQVLNSFTVPGSVSNSTGNINFIGHVQVDGNVLTGFKVEATGNITINGTVEGADIIAGGNVIIKEGVNGSGKGIVKSGGYIKTKYIQAGNVQAVGDIEAAFILHSEVHSGSAISLIGSKGTIVGGHATAMKTITTLAAGSRNSYVATLLEVGNDPIVLARSREIPKLLESNRKDAAALLRGINLLSEYKKAGRITPDKLETLQRSITTYKTLTQEAAELESELEGIQETIAESGFGSVNIAGSAYPGVIIIIGPERFPIENKYDRCSFARIDCEIQMVPLR
jgi:hypothetical protein